MSEEPTQEIPRVAPAVAWPYVGAGVAVLVVMGAGVWWARDHGPAHLQLKPILAATTAVSLIVYSGVPHRHMNVRFDSAAMAMISALGLVDGLTALSNLATQEHAPASEIAVGPVLVALASFVALVAAFRQSVAEQAPPREK